MEGGEVVFVGRRYDGEVKWMSQTMVNLEINGELLWLSRNQIGVLFLFTQAPELTRQEVYEYLASIWQPGEPLAGPLPTKYRAAMARLLNALKMHGLIVEHEKLLYQTMKGRIVWLAVQQFIEGRTMLTSVPAVDGDASSFDANGKLHKKAV